jgi:hypothetical protein
VPHGDALFVLTRQGEEGTGHAVEAEQGRGVHSVPGDPEEAVTAAGGVDRVRYVGDRGAGRAIERRAGRQHQRPDVDEREVVGHTPRLRRTSRAGSQSGGVACLQLFRHLLALAPDHRDHSQTVAELAVWPADEHVTWMGCYLSPGVITESGVTSVIVESRRVVSSLVPT